MTYTDVTPFQLFTGYVGMVIFMALAAWGWVNAIDQKNRADLADEEKRLYERSFLKAQEKRDAAIDKLKSLEAEIARITVRPRDKTGRFQRKQKY